MILLCSCCRSVESARAGLFLRQRKQIADDFATNVGSTDDRIMR
jgi:hypothetical protein